MADPLLATAIELKRYQGAIRGRWYLCLSILILACPLVWLALAQPSDVPDLGNFHLPVQTGMEVLSIVFAFMIFALGWQGISSKVACNVVILSAAFLATALLALCHLLLMVGMRDVAALDVLSRATVFGLASNGILAAALLAVAATPWNMHAGKRTRYALIAGTVLFAAAIAWAEHSRLNDLPHSFIEGQRLEPLAVWVHSTLVVLYLAAALAFLWRASALGDGKAFYLATAAIVFSLGELYLMVYAGPLGPQYILADLCKSVACGYLYYVIFLHVVRESRHQFRRSEQFQRDRLRRDMLTGLPTRVALVETLRQVVLRAVPNKTELAVLVLDVDFFKKVNAVFGHAAGDGVIRACVDRLAQSLSSRDMLARQGGDEFIIVQHPIADRAQAAGLAETLLRRMREPFLVQGHELFLSASIGIALFPDDATSEHGLLHKAHMAMSAVKRDARNAYRFHIPGMERTMREHLIMESSLRHAQSNNELTIHYQPKVNFNTGVVVGVEALLRWDHPELGQVSPARFIPIAEDNGCIEAIGMWVLSEACAQACRWQEQGLPLLIVSVNLSARQFQQSNLVEQVGKVLYETGLAPDRLELEITESTVMHDTAAAITILQSLKRLGVLLSVDDFGTGYSSLSSLKRFPIDVLKIDRSFVNDITHDANDAAITRAIIALAHGLDLNVVAEGVETIEQALFLQANGCDEMQGYYFGRPMGPDEFANALRKNRGLAEA